MATQALTQQTFDDVLANNDIVIVDFWADWCGPCSAFAPIFEKVSEKYPHIVFGKIDTEKERQLSADFNIRSIPFIMIFRQNIGVFAQGGVMPQHALEDLIQQTEALDMDEVRKEIARQQAAEGHD